MEQNLGPDSVWAVRNCFRGAQGSQKHFVKWAGGLNESVSVKFLVAYSWHIVGTK